MRGQEVDKDVSPRRSTALKTHIPNAKPATIPVLKRSGFVLSRHRASCVNPSMASGVTAMKAIVRITRSLTIGSSQNAKRPASRPA